jgi:uncharacterized protein HemY
MELPHFTVSVLILLTDLLVTALLGVQVYMFKQISAARREHLEFRIQVAEQNVRREDLTKAMNKLEENLERLMTAHFNNHNARN